MMNVINNPKIRVLETVRRWGIVPLLHRRSIAEHMYFVSLYAMEICDLIAAPPGLRLMVLQKAIKHDIPEVETGDISGPVKRHVVDPEKLEDYERMVLSQFVIEQTNTAALEKSILKAADYIDATWEIAWDMALGNRLVDNLLETELDRARHWMRQVALLSGKDLDAFWLEFAEKVRHFRHGPNIQWATDPT